MDPRRQNFPMEPREEYGRSLEEGAERNSPAGQGMEREPNDPHGPRVRLPGRHGRIRRTREANLQGKSNPAQENGVVEKG